MAQQIFFALLFLTLFPLIITAISICRESCKTNDNCYWKLICKYGICDDDPDIGSHLCNNGHLSTTMTSSTEAVLTYNDFSKGGDSGSPSECDGGYHEKNERVVALSTGRYAGESHCGKMINIKANNGRTTTAIVVDECDTTNGRKNNIVKGSASVWEDLALDININEVAVTWFMA